MALRKVNFNVSKSGIEPLDYAWGGIQNEDNATEINFIIANEYLSELNETCEKLFFRIDFESGFAGYNPSENLEMVDCTVKREIPKTITCFGGEFTSTLVVTRLLNNGEYQQILTVPVTLFFTSNNVSDQPLLNNLSAFEEHVLKNVKEASLIKQEIEQKLANGEFKGEKGEKGEKGDSYILTDADKQEIAIIVEGSKTFGDIDAALNNIIDIQEGLIGKEKEKIEASINNIIDIQNTLIGDESV